MEDLVPTALRKDSKLPAGMRNFSSVSKDTCGFFFGNLIWLAAE